MHCNIKTLSTLLAVRRYPLTSRLFGFKRPIAHALYLVARAEAALRNNGKEVAESVFF